MPGDNTDKNTELAIKESTPVKRPMMPIIVDHQEMLADFLPDHIDPDKFFLVANGVLRGSKYIRDCLNSQKGVQGFLGALKQCAMDGLIPDGKREAAIVPYKGVPTYVRMYGGMLKMMRQSGVVTDINTGLVCKNDEFDYSRGTENYVRHKVAFTNRGEMIAAWCVIRTKDGGEYFDIMGRDEIIQIKNAAKAKNGPWGNKAHEGQMWRKTVLRRTAGLAPISTDMHNAFAREDEENYNFDHLQRKSASERLVDNMARKTRGSVIDQDAPARISQDDPDDDVDDAILADSETGEIIEIIKPPKDYDDMTGQEWEDFATALIKDMEARKISSADFNALYSDDLDVMAKMSSPDFDRILDAFQANDIQGDGGNSGEEE